MPRTDTLVDDVTCSVPPRRDNLRGFFDRSFPVLLKRVFGYDDFEASWLNMVTKVRDGVCVCAGR